MLVFRRMTNEAQKCDSRFWAKWRRSGAVGNNLTAEVRPIKNIALPIVGIGSIMSGENAGHSTLSIGDKVINSGVDSKGHLWKVTKPVLAVVVPTQKFNLGQKVKAKDLPEGTSTIKDFFRR